MSNKTYVDNSHLKGKRLKDLLEDIKKYSEPKKGAKQELAFIERLKKHPIANKALIEMESADIRDYRNDRLKSVGNATVTREMGMISTFYAYAISEERGYKNLVNPVTSVKRPKPPRGRSRRLLEAGDEMTKIMARCYSESLRDFLPLAVETAMRRSELGNLCVEDVDLKNQTAQLHDTKNDEGRTVPLSLRATEILRRRIGERKAGRIFEVEYDTLTQAFGRARDRARAHYLRECTEKGERPNPQLFVDIVLHDMRHEATSRFFEDKGLDMVEVASITGHKGFRMLQCYTHLSAPRLAKKLG